MVSLYVSHLLLLRCCLLRLLRVVLRGPLRQTPGDELVPLHQPHEPAFREPPGMNTEDKHGRLTRDPLDLHHILCSEKRRNLTAVEFFPFSKHRLSPIDFSSAAG